MGKASFNCVAVHRLLEIITSASRRVYRHCLNRLDCGVLAIASPHGTVYSLYASNMCLMEPITSSDHNVN